MHVLVTALLLLVPTLANSQTTTEWPFTDRYSLIRTITPSTYMLFSNDGQNIFYYVDVSNPVTPFLIINNKGLTVTDFEIMDDIVYFCGYIISDNNYSAVLGYFPLAGFPSVDVLYNAGSGMILFNRLDLYTVYDQVHAVLTGVDANGISTMVDAIHFSDSTWQYHIVDGNNLGEMFEDVVTVKSGSHPIVVFSSRDRTMNYPFMANHSRTWTFKFPTAINMPIFSNPYLYFQLDQNAKSTVELESMGGWFASAYKTTDDSLIVNRYAQTDYDHSVRIYCDPSLTVKDIQYNFYWGFALDVLVTSSSMTTVDSYIYNVKEYHFDTNTIMKVHRYDDEDLNSLALSSAIENYYRASGHEPIYQNLRAYSYNYNSWNCAKQVGATYTNMKFPYGRISGSVYYKVVKATFSKIGRLIGSIETERICPE